MLHPITVLGNPWGEWEDFCPSVGGERAPSRIVHCVRASEVDIGDLGF